MKRLSEDLSLSQCVGVSLFAPALDAGLTFLASLTCIILGYEAVSDGATRLFVDTPCVIMYLTVRMVVPIEEAIFRLLPAVFVLCVMKGVAQDCRIITLVVALCVSAALFALAHSGEMNVLVHTPFGLVFGAVFLRCGGGAGRLSRGYLFSVVVHLLCTLVAVWYTRPMA